MKRNAERRSSTAINSAIPTRDCEELQLPGNIRLRELLACDSVEQLTDMLHRAFAKLGKMHVPCSSVAQTVDVTRRRISRGTCFVAVAGERIVGTITINRPDETSLCGTYRDTRIASAHQLGVDPEFQCHGIGSALLRLAQHWARLHGYAQIALDTPEPAKHLIEYYDSLGFGAVDAIQFAGRPYRSVVFSKAVVQSAESGRSARGAILEQAIRSGGRILAHVQSAC